MIKKINNINIFPACFAIGFFLYSCGGGNEIMEDIYDEKQPTNNNTYTTNPNAGIPASGSNNHTNNNYTDRPQGKGKPVAEETNLTDPENNNPAEENTVNESIDKLTNDV